VRPQVNRVKVRAALLGCVATASALFVALSAKHGKSAPGAVREFSTIHSHQSAAESAPLAPLVSDSAGNLYGTTSGGDWGLPGGVVFTVRTDGTEFRRLHTFTGSTGDGFYPRAALLLDERGTLYGTTSGGGPLNAGTIFRLNSDGTEFQLLHSFSAWKGDGASPAASLILGAEGKLYGTTEYGGSANFGTIFSVETDGTGYEILHSFKGGVGDGRLPHASLVLDGAGNLFGTTLYGGQPGSYNMFGDYFDGYGSVFTVRTDGTGFQVLYTFLPEGSEGIWPSGSLIIDGSGRMYGATSIGGATGYGTIFSLNRDGTGFKVLHSFGMTDGRPIGSLAFDGAGDLFGTSEVVSGSTGAIIFTLRTDGTNFRVLHTTDAIGGHYPNGGLLLDSSRTLFGTMAYGGAFLGGTIYRIRTDGSDFETVLDFSGSKADGMWPQASLIRDGSGNLYGTTTIGGARNAGTVFTVRPDGSGFRVLHSFGNDDVVGPSAPLVLDASGYLYGTSGGLRTGGVVFRLKTDGTGFEILHLFTPDPSDGFGPQSSLILDGSGNLYGTTRGGGGSGCGTVFKMRTDGTNFQVLHAFSSGSSDGSTPWASLILDGSENLYGTTLYGGSWTTEVGGTVFTLLGVGTIFTLRTDGTGFTLLHSFAVRANDGAGPMAALLLDASGNLYGTTIGGGSMSRGTIFKIRKNGTDFHVLHSFAGNPGDGATPYSSLVLDDSGNLYGTTFDGGPSNVGTVFTIKTDGSAYQLLHVFAGGVSDGSNPWSSLLLDRSGQLFGTTKGGGSANVGTEFTLFVGRHQPVTAPGTPVRRR
jgi:uncharacterized repeat protein (TIGR03803 family)